MDLVFLGTGAGNGVPTFYCDCPVCDEAKGAERLRRTRSAVMIMGNRNYLIDAPPELSSQLLREKIKRVDHLFLTHSHHDHSGGLGDLEIYARYYLKGKLSAVMSWETLDELEKADDSVREWLEVTLIEPFHTQSYSGVEFTGLPVSHSPGTLGYMITTKNGRTAYIPDTGPLPEECKSLIRGVDNLVLDATFNGQNWYPAQHHSIQEAIETARELAVKRLYLTHLSMHYSKPVTSEALEREIVTYGDFVHLAYDGMRMKLADC
jgi:phosphoribosyl 1,2-cyclic phosphate phosphodiesterase